MKYILIIKKTGAGNWFWSYNLFIDGKLAPMPPLIYRMWHKKQTAIRNGMKQLNKYLK